jgi:signal transduction histidine kinase
MRERTELLGGQFELDAGPGIGTRVRALLPLTGLADDEP